MNKDKRIEEQKCRCILGIHCRVHSQVEEATMPPMQITKLALKQNQVVVEALDSQATAGHC